MISCKGNSAITSLTLFKYKFYYILLSIVIFACFDNIFAMFGLSFDKWVNIFEDYFDRMLLRWESTEKSKIPHKIYMACLSVYTLSVFTRVYESTEIASLIINGVL